MVDVNEREGDRTPGRVLYLTVRHPADAGEEFLRAELRALRRLVPVVEVPMRPISRDPAPDLLCQPLLAPAVLKSAIWTTLRRPLAVGRAIWRVLDLRRPVMTARNIAVLPKALWLAGQTHPGDFLLAGWLTTPATVAMVAAELRGLPWATSAHRGDISDAAPLRRKVAAATFVRVISEDGAAALGARIGDGPASPIHVLHLGIDVPAEPAPRRHGHGFRILSIGALSERKNHVTLIRALHETDQVDVRLSIAGAGNQHGVLEALAEALGVADRVKLLGHLDHEDLLESLDAGAWDLVSSASLSEGIPVSLMEALGRGVPVVASDVGGTRELVAPAGGVLIEDPSDPAAFAAGWQQLRSTWDEAAAARAHAFVLEAFCADAVAVRLLRCMSSRR